MKEKTLNNLSIIFGAVGIFGVIENYNWITIEQRIALIFSIILLFTSAAISLYLYFKKRKFHKK